MAFTYEELLAWLPGKSYPSIAVTLVITQEDGRTAHGSGGLNSLIMTADQIPGDLNVRFSDRRHEFFATPTSGYYVQPFYARDEDPVGIVFRKLAAGQFRLTQTLKRWGNAHVVVDLTKAPASKLYVGYGPTIAAGPGQAHYAFSINSAVPTPG